MKKLLLVLLLIVFLSACVSEKVYETKEEQKIGMLFKDVLTDCTLDGEVFVNNSSVGFTKDGNISLDKNIFTNEKHEIYIRGNLDECFDTYNNWVYDVCCWFVDKKEIEENQVFELTTKIEPRKGAGRLAMNYIQPENLSDYLNFSYYTSESSIWNYLNQRFTWKEDEDIFGESEHWQLPYEFLQRKEGDCEDWASVFVSLALARNSSSNCFAVEMIVNNTKVSGHVGTVCLEGKKLLVFDQFYSRVWYTTDYFLGEWCKSLENVTSCEVTKVFNNKFYKTFDSSSEFIDWLKGFL